MLSSAFVCLFVCTGLNRFSKMRWESGTSATEETIEFDGNPDHVTLGFVLGLMLGLRLDGDK